MYAYLFAFVLLLKTFVLLEVKKKNNNNFPVSLNQAGYSL